MVPGTCQPPFWWTKQVSLAPNRPLPNRRLQQERIGHLPGQFLHRPLQGFGGVFNIRLREGSTILRGCLVQSATLVRRRPSQVDVGVDGIDIGETSNVAAKHPEIVRQLQKKLDAWESELVTPLWGPGSPVFCWNEEKTQVIREMVP